MRNERVGGVHKRFWIAGLLVLCVAVAGGAVGCYGAEVITLWQPWGGALLQGWKALAEEFEQSHPQYELDVVEVSAHETNDKLFAAIAGGAPPDVTAVVGFQVAEWAHSGVLQALDPWLQRSNVDSAGFFPGAWKSSMYDGRMYAMAVVLDPNFAVGVNRAILDEAGIADPPQTIDELTKQARKLTRFDDSGTPTRLAMEMWSVYGGANTIRTWGWAFGGDFVDLSARKVTADEPRIVQAMEWLLQELEAANRQIPPGGFSGGGIAYAPLVTSNLLDLKKRNPEFRLEATRMPRGQGVPPGVEWLGGWRLGVPTGARNAQGGWDLVYWVTATGPGSLSVGRNLGFFNGYGKSPYIREAMANELLRPYIEVMQEARYSYFGIPVENTFSIELDKAWREVLVNKSVTAKAAMEDVTRLVQTKWDELLRQ